MNRWAVGGLGAAAVVAAAGAGLWWVGAQRLGAALDRAEAQLADGGVRLSHGGRSVGGFPFGYAVAYRDLAVTAEGAAWRFSAPAASGRAALSAPRRIALALPQGGRLALTPPDGGAPLDFAVEAEGLTLDTGGAEPGPSLAADALSFEHVAPQGLRLARLALTGVAAGFSRTDGVARVTIDVAEADAARDVEAPEGRTLSDSVTRGLSLRLDARGPAAPDLLAFALAGGEGELSVRTEGATVSGATQAPGAPALDFRGEAGPTEMRGSLAAGRVAWALDAGAARWAGRGGAIGDREAALTLGALVAEVEGPLAPTPDPQPARLRLTLSGLDADPASWDAFDPAATLPREPLTARIDASAAVRWRASLARAADVGQAPVDVTELAVEGATLTGLGLSARLSGRAALDPAPAGAFDLRVDGWRPVLAALEAAGALPPEQARFVEDWAALYGADPAAPTSIVSRIAIDPSGVTANGLPLN
jgi:hypothetical protein